VKAENSRAFVLCGEEPRTPVLLLDQNSDTVAENTRDGSDLVLIVPRRAVLYLRPGCRAVAARSGGCRTRGAGRTMRARNALFTKSYMLSPL